MHVPDGFLDAPTSVATMVVAGGVVAASLVRASRRELDERTAPLAGLVAVFVFAAQMVNFPVGAGTSGHLIGAALAAVLVGPATATLCLTVVLAVQAFLFADGGVTALGTNVVLMGVVAVWVGYGVARAVLAVLPRRMSSVPLAAAASSFVSVPAAALVFTGLFAVGGVAPIPLGPLVATMLGWHLLIGVGEALITFLAVSSIVAARPDLVHAARGRMPALQLRTPEPVA
ncbi:energy-coupling factor ABC transporter permease [Phycicoccus duodecadis]|uniref:energy-coupling factor ABC transporter permease n=1 Tax=Phycicoccus duodecadis TaxID=173053 RepID=UPI000C6FF471|nr:energy-coupling factor ABC transporter permease [Phycicoccus duodecadis]